MTDFGQPKLWVPPAKVGPVRSVTVPPAAGRPLMPGDSYECQERRRADIIRGAQERVWWTYYDSEAIQSSVAATQAQYYFRNPIGAGVPAKTKIRTNMTTAGTLPDPQEFIVHYVACYIFPYPSGAATLNDISLIANNCVMTLQVNQKTYYETLSWDMPSGGGQRYQGPAGSLTAAPEFLWNGDANQIGIKRLRVPVFILKNQAFNWFVEMDQAAFNLLTADISIYFYILMHGELYRQIT